MTLVTISPTYRITIPKEIREKFNVEPGQKAIFTTDGKALTIHFERPIQKARGSLKGIEPSVERDEEDRI
jgi:AbrB family looped-hinge helix DNA binding protein